MRYAEIERFCLSLPATSSVVQWGGVHVFKVGGKMFALLSPMEERPQTLAFKVSDDSFHILTQQDGIAPAPYLAKSHWIQLDKLDLMGAKELKAYLTRAHGLIAAGLSKKKRAELGLAL
ncbi:putative DNA-binding protein (MmcQ/YjbR family) [Rhizomicrobium palustre]|uniref:Putative DNA-binding protein (MmcQ/YjbR family) n=1 Tax=Rhizomicrobium palustre TaxID=189966 RepID=A0A846MZJ3_9PROT|nr:MmcQ/YjbR family DNA-binding protein [Rhizomicrobium palustre]NIK88655.1 putative DNA-binding protein (MmcQ/YjbR family) [Rhizomicrobium palustre]